MRGSKLLIVFIVVLLTAVSFSQQEFGKVVEFDGDGDYANTFNDPYLPTPNGTLEAWVKVLNISDNSSSREIGDMFFSKNEEQWNTGDLYVFFESGTGYLKSRIQAPFSSQFDLQSNNSFNQSAEIWFHYAFSWGSGGMKMFINGVLQNDQNSITSSALNNNYNIYVGAHGWMLHNGTYVLSEFFNGQMDELRIWDHQKSSEEIFTLSETPLDSAYYITADSGLVGYWKFDELEDLGINNDGVDDVRDFSGRGNHLDFAGDTHLVPSDLIVPVELYSFTGEVSGSIVNLSWITATETNNYGFELERKLFDNWEKIAFIEGNGNAVSSNYYFYPDDLTSLQTGTKIYYRLKQIDYDGSFEYLDEIEIDYAPASFQVFQNYPNPFNPSTTINYYLPQSTKVKLEIFDVIGGVVRVLVDEEKDAGTYSVQFDAGKLASGIYYYRFTTDYFNQTRKMLLLK